MRHWFERDAASAASQSDNPAEQMIVTGLNAAWIASLPKASNVDGLSVPRTEAVFGNEISNSGQN
jgi:hypothetical protein